MIVCVRTGAAHVDVRLSVGRPAHLSYILAMTQPHARAIQPAEADPGMSGRTH